MREARCNKMREMVTCEITLDDMVTTPDGGVDFHPDLTTHLSHVQWERLYDGMAMALRRGMVMNVHVTITWARLGVTEHDEASASLERLLAVLRKRAQERGYPSAFAYAHENAANEGLHTHLLTVWPQAERAAFATWFTAYMHKRGKRGVLHDPQAVKVRHERDNDVARHWLWFGYISKGLYAGGAVRDLHEPTKWWPMDELLLRRPEDTGVVRCRKRVGVSGNIDKAARQAAGFRSALRRGGHTKAELYSDVPYQEHRAEWLSNQFRL